MSLEKYVELFDFKFNYYVESGLRLNALYLGTESGKMSDVF